MHLIQIHAPISLVLPEIVPVSPSVDCNLQQKSISPLEIAMLESPSSSASNSTQDDGKISNIVQAGGGLFSWVKEAMPGKQMLQKVAEKARSSMDTMITTLDPQMKEIICENMKYSYIFT